MKNLTTYNDFLNEGLSTDEKSVSNLIKEINKLPDTIKSLKVPTSLSMHGGQSKEFIPAEDKNWKKEAIKQIKDTLKDKAAKKIDTFSVRSFFGKGGPKDPYYVNFDSEDHREFAKAMGSGKYGSLD